MCFFPSGLNQMEESIKQVPSNLGKVFRVSQDIPSKYRKSVSLLSPPPPPPLAWEHVFSERERERERERETDKERERERQRKRERDKERGREGERERGREGERKRRDVFCFCFF